MGRFIAGLVVGAFLALAISPYIFPYGFPSAVQVWESDVRSDLPLIKAYFALP